MKKSIRILLAGANPYNANKGVAALAFSTMRILKELEQELDVEIQICVYTSESTNVYDSIVFPNGLLKFQNIYPSDLFSIGDIFRVFTSKWKLYNLRELCKCNYIVNITGGDSFSDIYGANNFNSVNKINRLAHILRIPYLFLPQTYGPFFSPQIKRKAIKALSKADLLLSRDEISAKFLANELPNNKIASYMMLHFTSLLNFTTTISKLV
jgi:polysaccharide pyruvyl transferase WcaK-like protein